MNGALIAVVRLVLVAFNVVAPVLLKLQLVAVTTPEDAVKMRPWLPVPVQVS